MSSILYYSVSMYPREAHFNLGKNCRVRSAERIDRGD